MGSIVGRWASRRARPNPDVMPHDFGHTAVAAHLLAELIVLARKQSARDHDVHLLLATMLV